ncbi:ComEA family DNA-binding protein [Flagellimonas eckloniae]|uniref:Competence protein ComEA n=1 Tax=Flagellimonas eckloniae TaxID=346185 RepID=A0A0Q0XES0_9FLAO|nr:helix-hairpin-helix domain-containing protein [Allomuricauda eckloniae]KQC29656.1 hypothetical protein AAY42_06985 [Allomuricauda eckloniae]
MKSHFKFNKQERNGIFFLLLLIVILQGLYFLIKSQPNDGYAKLSVNAQEQSMVDSLKNNILQKDSIKLYPFNPNFISDYKGYTLGMSPMELERLFVFRKQENFVNSIEEFQDVTKVSDSLLNVISPYFKFPEWTQKKKTRFTKSISNNKSEEKKAKEIRDLNLATADELKTINGIGDKLSVRIVKFRDRLGGFLVNEQLYDVYGLDSEVVDRTLKKFSVVNVPKIKKINVNKSTASEISELVYISHSVAIKILEYRELKGRINSFDELTSIEGFPSNKLDRIVLYLSL